MTSTSQKKGKPKTKKRPFIESVSDIYSYWNLNTDAIIDLHKPYKKAGPTDDTAGPDLALELYYDGQTMDTVHKARFDNEIHKLYDKSHIYSCEPCIKCGKHTVISYDKQMRRADEPATIFQICMSCNFTRRS